MTYTVIYERGSSSWGAYVPGLPGVASVASVGESRKEVEQMIREGIEFHREGTLAEGGEIQASVA